jgi:hypothetical protein
MAVLALARLGQVDEARRRARAGLAAALVELGALRRRSGSRRAAEAELRAGLDLAGRLGATRLVKRARAELLAMGRRPRRTALTGLDAPTGTERRVADLATQGLTNKGTSFPVGDVQSNGPKSASRGARMPLNGAAGADV